MRIAMVYFGTAIVAAICFAPGRTFGYEIKSCAEIMQKDPIEDCVAVSWVNNNGKTGTCSCSGSTIADVMHDTDIKDHVGNSPLKNIDGTLLGYAVSGQKTSGSLDTSYCTVYFIDSRMVRGKNCPATDSAE
jgi:hypothetical protein